LANLALSRGGSKSPAAGAEYAASTAPDNTAAAPTPGALFTRVALEKATPSGLSVSCDAFFAACKDDVSIVEAQAFAMLDRPETMAGLALSLAAMALLLQRAPDVVAKQHGKAHPHLALKV
jgi:hypothetical protein